MSNGSLTELLRRYSSGEREIGDALFREIFPTLHKLAVRQLARERFVAPVTPTELVNELWLRSLNRPGWEIVNREHFYAIVAMAMRHLLVDLARRRLALSRGGGEVPASFEDGQAHSVADAKNLEEIVSIGLLMDRLAKKDALWALIFDMFYFAGYTLEEIAEATGLTVRQVKYRWEKAERCMKGWMAG